MPGSSRNQIAAAIERILQTAVLIVENEADVFTAMIAVKENRASFADALIAIVKEADSDPQLLHDAPHDSPVRRLDEATAARQPDLRWRPMTGAEPVCPQ